MKSPCYRCSRSLLVAMDFGRQDVCPGCGFPTRVCRNCSHFDPSRYNECTEPVADRVVDKEKGNFCDYFKAGPPSQGASSSAASAKSAAEALFKKTK